MSEQDMNRLAREIVGEGVHPAQAQDALETALNHIIGGSQPIGPSAEEAVRRLESKRKLLDTVERQRVRSQTKIDMQQFSTPPDYAQAVAWLANLTPNDVVMEPSAGTGNLAAAARNEGAGQVYANELDASRREMIGTLGLTSVTEADARFIDSMTEGMIPTPTVVVMNPPFSRDAERTGSKRQVGMDLEHTKAALRKLAPGGRLVAIVGAPLHKAETKTFQKWYGDIKREYNVRANVVIDRNVYKRMGTSFPTRLLIIDKTGPTQGTPVHGEMQLDDAVRALEAIRNDRQPAQQQPGQPGSAGTDASPGGGSGTNTPTRDDAGDVVPPNGPQGQPSVQPGPTINDAQPGGEPGQPGGSGGSSDVSDAGSPGTTGVGDQQGEPVAENVQPGGDSVGEPGRPNAPTDRAGNRPPNVKDMTPEQRRQLVEDGMIRQIIMPIELSTGMNAWKAIVSGIDRAGTKQMVEAVSTSKIYQPVRDRLKVANIPIERAIETVDRWAAQQRVQVDGGPPMPEPPPSQPETKPESKPPKAPPPKKDPPKNDKLDEAKERLRKLKEAAEKKRKERESQNDDADESAMSAEGPDFELLDLAMEAVNGVIDADVKDFEAFVELTGEILGQDLMMEIAPTLEMAWQSLADADASLSPATSIRTLVAGKGGGKGGSSGSGKGGGKGGGRGTKDKPATEPTDTSSPPAADQAADQDDTERTVERPEGKEVEPVFQNYQEREILAGSKNHPAQLQESTAMGSVPPPKMDYVPNLPKELVQKGEFSKAQIEVVQLAGWNHEQHLPDRTRAGVLIGDGTGVGKTREVIGMILDNQARGRKRHVIVTKNDDLVRDFIKEWEGLGLDKKQVMKLAGVPVEQKDPDDPKAKPTRASLPNVDGVVLLTYGTLSTAKAKERVAQVVEWAGGEKHQGLLVFDEAHMMKNAFADTAGGRFGGANVSDTALHGLMLQGQMPDARVAYFSATAATEVANLAYAERLGLWGVDTGFANKERFIERIGGGGVSAMEIVAWNMKALGKYLARSISFDGVKVDRLDHDLTPGQTQAYDSLADAWLQVYKQALEAVKRTGGGRKQMILFRSMWAGGTQRFFNQVIVAMQMPSVLASMRKDLDAGHAVVLQLVNTQGSDTDTRAKAAQTQEELEDFDTSLRDVAETFIKNQFPTQQYVQRIDPVTGKPVMVPVFLPKRDANGNIKRHPDGTPIDDTSKPVQNPEAVRIRDALILQVKDALSAAPDNAIEQILQVFGHENVAEITGRGIRIEEVEDEATGQLAKKKINRTNTTRAKEIQEFNDGDRRILIFSDKGGTGKSYHAGLNMKNQALRRHYLLQPGWRADGAIQGFGRTHRSNQAQPPEYVLVSTDVPGQRRFLATIARRLAQLGALTKGQRQGAGTGFFQDTDNLESPPASEALILFLQDIQGGRSEIDAGEFQDRTLLRLLSNDGKPIGRDALPDMPDFLNAMLRLPVNMQKTLFNEFETIFKRVIEAKRERGELDVGLETYRADSIKETDRRTVRENKDTGAKTEFVEVETSIKVHPKGLQTVLREVGTADFLGYVKSVGPGGKYWVVAKAPDKMNPDTGEKVPQVRLYDQLGNQTKPREKLEEARYWTWVKDEKEIETGWEEQVRQGKQVHTAKRHYVTGLLLPIWDKLGRRVRVERIILDNGKQFLGRHIAHDELNAVMRNLGLATDGGWKGSTAEAFNGLWTGQVQLVELANGYTMRRTNLGGQAAIELRGVPMTEQATVEQMGFQFQRRNGKPYFTIVSRSDDGLKAFERAAEQFVIVNVRLRGGGSGVAGYIPTEKELGESGYYADSGDADADDAGVANFQTSPGSPNIPATNDDVRTEKSRRRIEAGRIIDTMVKLFGVNKRIGKLGPRNALGTYNFWTDLLRLHGQNTHDLAVMTHEVAHHIDKHHEPYQEKAKQDPAFKAELVSLDYDYPAKSRIKEGWAEFLRLYLTTDSASSHQRVYAWFTQEYLPANPEIAKKLLTVKKLINEWRQQGSRQRYRVSETGRPQGSYVLPTVKERVDTLWDKLVTDWVDKGRIWHRFDEAAKAAGLNFSNVAGTYELFFAMEGTAYARSVDAIENGPRLLGGNMQRVGKGLREALEPVKQSEYDDWTQFVWATHALEVYARARQDSAKANKQIIINPGMPEEEARWIVQQAKNTPDVFNRWTEAHTNLTKFNNDLLEVLVDAGVLTKPEAAKMKRRWRTYIPLYRETPKGTLGKFASNMLDQHGVVKRRIGSGAPILDPVESTMRRAMAFYQVALKQAVMRRAVQIANPRNKLGLGGWLAPIKPGTRTIKFGLAEVWGQLIEALDAQGVDTTTLDQTVDVDDLGVAKIYRPNYDANRRKYYARVLVDGRPQLWEVDKDLYETLDTMQQAQVGPMLRLIETFNGYRKTGAVTLNPGFIARNIMMDWIAYQGQAKYAGLESLYAPAWWTAAFSQNQKREMLGQSSENEVIDLWKEFGGHLMTWLGSQSRKVSAYRKDLVAHDAPQHVRQALKPTNWLNNVKEIVAVSEVGPRLTEFYAYLKTQGYTLGKDGKLRDKNGNRTRPPRHVLVRAFNASQESTTPFKRSGLKGRYVDKWWTFLNAAVQGASQAALVHREAIRGERSAKRLMLFYAVSMSAGLLYWFLRKDDDDYVAQDNWVDDNIVILNSDGDPVIRLPKGRAWSAPMRMVEGVLDAMYRENPERLTNAVERLIHQEVPTSGPPVVTPAIELMRNKSFFTGREIVPPHANELKPQLQHSSYTLETTKFVTKAISEWTGEVIDMPPGYVEHFVDSSVGGAYRRFAEPFETGEFAQLFGLAMKRDYVKDMPDFYEAMEDGKREYDSARKEGEVDREQRNTYLQLDEYGDLMKELRGLIDDTRDRDARFEVEKYMIGLARHALGRDELARYPNPLTNKDLPAPVKKVIAKYRATLQRRMVQGVPRQGKTETLTKYRERVEDFKDLRKRTLGTLKSMAGRS